MTIGG
jgi:hypothetical protein